MKILHLADSFLPSIGGVQIVVHALACEQGRAGHEPSVLTQRRRVDALAGKVPYTVLGYWPAFSHAVRAVQQGWAQAWFSAFVGYVQKKGRFDVWHLHNSFPEALFLPELKRRGIPCILTCHGDELCASSEQAERARQHLALAGRVAVLCPASRQYVEQHGVASDAIVGMDNGLSPASFAQPVDRSAERARYGIPQDVPLFISAGRNSPEKGFDLIVPLVQDLQARKLSFHWCVVGRGSSDIAAAAQAAGVGDRITALSPFELAFVDGALQHPAPEYARLLQSADVYVGLSRSEAFYLALYEGLAAGLAGVFTHTARAPELAAAGCGLMVQPDDRAQAAAALTRMLEDPLFRTACAARGRAFVQRYDWQNIARRYVDMYRAVCEMR